MRAPAARGATKTLVTTLVAALLAGVAATAIVGDAVAQGAPPAQPAPRVQGGGAPPPTRELTPAEISALQTMMTNRANGALLSPANADAIRRAMMETQSMLPPTGTLDAVKPEPRSLDVDPQTMLAKPETIQLALGVVTPITFLDASGRPWPVESVAFDPRMFAQDGNGCGSQTPQAAVSGSGERPSTITIMPCRINTFGNVSIKLENYPLPLVLMAKSGANGTVDLPVTVHVRGKSPSTPMAMADAIAAYSPPAAHYAPRRGGGRRGGGGGMEPDRYLDTFGAGAPPASAQRVQVDDPSVTGWIFEGRLYVRGAVTVVNPAQDAVAESVGGMKVWRFDHPVPRILVVDETGNERDIALSF